MAWIWFVPVWRLPGDTDGMSRRSPDDNTRYSRAPIGTPAKTRCRLIKTLEADHSRIRNDRGIGITDNWSGTLPVSAAELQVFEAFFLDFLEEMVHSR